MFRNFNESKGSTTGNPATKRGFKPGDYPIGSLQSRAAARAMLEARPQVTVTVVSVATGEIIENICSDIDESK